LHFNGSVSVTGNVTVGQGSVIEWSETHLQRRVTILGGNGTFLDQILIVQWPCVLFSGCSVRPGAPIGSANQSFCSGATVSSLVPTGSNIKWYASSSGGSALSTSLSLVKIQTVTMQLK
jgi:hypothetical protein